ncbi:MAG TPA: hypothetical protein VKS22_16435 [Candidatus Binataceae bacterium]|nr:hypothetical protein [Candidatus Binataceae bacterium]
MPRRRPAQQVDAREDLGAALERHRDHHFSPHASAAGGRGSEFQEKVESE